MEWIETTGKTIEEAKEAALDELGVDETDAEFEVLAEPKTGLFGRMRVEARVRSRVRPTAPRPKDDRRDRRRRSRGSKDGTPAAAAAATAPAAGGVDVDATEAAATSGAEAPEQVNGDGAEGENGSSGGPKRNRSRTGRRRSGGAAGSPSGEQDDDTQTAPVATAERPSTPRSAPARADRSTDEKRDEGLNAQVPLELQGDAARDFLNGLLETFGLTAQVAVTLGAEDVVDVAVTGEGLGLLIGPRGSTLLAIQDLTRAAVQQKTGSGSGRINVDVAGYREKRTEALRRFALQVAETVRSTGDRQALEPMSPVDRKVVHDTLTDFEGVSTISEGEDTRRRVVIIPAQS